MSSINTSSEVHVVTTVGPRDFEAVRMTVFCWHVERTVWLGECPDCESTPSKSASPGVEGVQTPVRNVMQKDVFCVRPDVTVDELVTLLVEHGFSGMPIVDEDGRPVGVVSMSDVLRHRYEQLEDEEAGFGVGRRGAQVADLMKSLPVTVEENVSLAEASRKMASHRIHRLPVVNAHGVLVGLLSALDVVAWLGAQG